MTPTAGRVPSRKALARRVTGLPSEPGAGRGFRASGANRPDDERERRTRRRSRSDAWQTVVSRRARKWPRVVTAHKSATAAGVGPTSSVGRERCLRSLPSRLQPLSESVLGIARRGRPPAATRCPFRQESRSGATRRRGFRVSPRAVANSAPVITAALIRGCACSSRAMSLCSQVVGCCGEARFESAPRTFRVFGTRCSHVRAGDRGVGGPQHHHLQDLDVAGGEFGRAAA
jgi:hypothetical protein